MCMAAAVLVPAVAALSRFPEVLPLECHVRIQSRATAPTHLGLLRGVLLCVAGGISTCLVSLVSLGLGRGGSLCGLVVPGLSVFLRLCNSKPFSTCILRAVSAAQQTQPAQRRLEKSSATNRTIASRWHGSSFATRCRKAVVHVAQVQVLPRQCLQRP